MSNPFICQPMSTDEYNQRLDAMIDQHCQDITDELYQKGYQQGRADALSELWKKAIYKFDEVLSLEDLSELIDEQIKEQTNE